MADKKSALAEFKDFVMQGNVVDLAVAVVIATFFGQIIKDFVNLILSILTIPGTRKTDFSGLTFKIGHGVFHYGAVLNDIVTFVVVAAAVFFLVVHPVHQLADRRRAVPDPDSESRPCPECLSEIPKAANRCAFCASEVGAAA